MPRRLGSRSLKRTKRRAAGKSYRRRRYVRTRANIQPVQFHSRCSYTVAQYTSSSVGAGGAVQFSLNGVPSVTDFTSLYDQYKINGVKVEFIPDINNVQQSATPGGPIMGMLHTAIDYNSASTPSSLNQILQYPNLRSTRMTRIHKRYFRPRVAMTVYDGAVANGYGTSARSQWLDCQYPDIPHYGLLVWLDATSPTSIQFNMKVTYYLAFRQAR